jgi:hypothetical protein
MYLPSKAPLLSAIFSYPFGHNCDAAFGKTSADGDKPMKPPYIPLGEVAFNV